MSNLNITNVDLGNVIYESGQFQDDTYDAASTAALVEGTILGRSSVDGKLGLFNKAGANGLDVPVAIMTYAQSDIVVGDVAVRVAISGTFHLERLVIADGDPVITEAVKDQLKSSSMVAVSVSELANLDNQ